MEPKSWERLTAELRQVQRMVAALRRVADTYTSLSLCHKCRATMGTSVRLQNAWCDVTAIEEEMESSGTGETDERAQ